MANEISLDDLAKEAIRQDKNFIIDIGIGDSRAVTLNNDVVVIFTKIRNIGKRKSEMEITACFKSVHIDMKLIETED